MSVASAWFLLALAVVAYLSVYIGLIALFRLKFDIESEDTWLGSWVLRRLSRASKPVTDRARRSLRVMDELYPISEQKDIRSQIFFWSGECHAAWETYTEKSDSESDCRSQGGALIKLNLAVEKLLGIIKDHEPEISATWLEAVCFSFPTCAPVTLPGYKADDESWVSERTISLNRSASTLLLELANAEIGKRKRVLKAKGFIESHMGWGTVEMIVAAEAEELRSRRAWRAYRFSNVWYYYGFFSIMLALVAVLWHHIGFYAIILVLVAAIILAFATGFVTSERGSTNH